MINFLISANQHACGKESKVRDYNGLKIIETAINNCMESTKPNGEYIKECLKCAALIKLLQPFFDGNHRTGLIIFSILLENKGIEFDINKALIDMKNMKLNLPTIYSEEDTVTNFDKYKKYIKTCDFEVKNKKTMVL